MESWNFEINYELEEEFVEECNWVLLFLDEGIFVDEEIIVLLLFFEYFVGEGVNVENFEEVEEELIVENKWVFFFIEENFVVDELIFIKMLVFIYIVG